jgi:hypothetical protein
VRRHLALPIAGLWALIALNLVMVWVYWIYREPRNPLMVFLWLAVGTVAYWRSRRAGKSVSHFVLLIGPIFVGVTSTRRLYRLVARPRVESDASGLMLLAIIWWLVELFDRLRRRPSTI